MFSEYVKKPGNKYLALWQTLSGWRLFFFYTLHYTVLFFLLCPVIFGAFIDAEKTFMWNPDGITNYFPRLVYLSQTVRDGLQAFLAGEGWQIPLYDFTLGPAKLNWVAEPIQWVAIFWPRDQIDILFDALVFLRFYLVGLSFSVFGFFFKQKPIPILVGAVTYTFCGFMLYAGVRDNFSFVHAVIYLPLLIVGIEKTIKDGRSFLLIAVVFLAMTSSLYMACMLAILAVLYVLVRIPEFYRPDRPQEILRLVGRLAAGAGIGIALSGAMTIPSLVMMLGTGRVGRDVTSSVDFFSYGKAYYEQFLSDFIVIPDQFLADTYLGFSVLALPAIILLFVNRKRNERSLRILFLLLTSLMLLPAAAYVFSAFNAIKNRWCFAYALCVSAVLMFKLPDLIKLDRHEKPLVGMGTLSYAVICFFVIDHQYYNEGSIALLVVAMIVLFLLQMPKKEKKQLQLLLCLVITCFSVCHSASLLYDADQGNYVAEFISKGVPYDYYTKSPYASFAQSKSVEQDNAFYRVASNSIGKAMNLSFYSGINGLSCYSSFTYTSYAEWIRELELARVESAHRYFGLRSRSPMLTLAATKYYVLRKTGAEVVPYGFQEIERVENNGKTDAILINEYALPVGYTYKTYLTQEEYTTLSALEKQEAQLQAVVLSDAPDSVDITEASVTTTAQQIPIINVSTKGLDWKNGTLKIKEEKATITLEFEGLPNTETYLRVVGLDLTNGGSTRRWSISASTGTTATDARFSAEGYLYDHGMKTQLLDLGYTEEGYTKCTITFPKKHTVKLENLEIWCQAMDHYGEQVNDLREEVLENVETNWRGLTGAISVSRDKMLCIAIPYDKGWTAYVDGEKVKLYQANTAFMAVELSAGDHEIELKYWTPGLTVGIVLSAFGVIGLGSVIICWKRKKS